MSMEELSPDELDEVLRAPKARGRKTKKLERDYHTWFYDLNPATHLGKCDNPECEDPRKKSRVFVWEHPSGQHMCRYCFLTGWLLETSEAA